jgi:hypothetical protein
LSGTRPPVPAFYPTRAICNSRLQLSQILKHFDVVLLLGASLMVVRRHQSDQAPKLHNFSLRKIAMKSSSIVVAALLSALTLPVFAQTGTAAATTATPAATTATTAAPKAETATKHKTVKHAAKKEKAEKVSANTSTDTAAAKSK